MRRKSSIHQYPNNETISVEQSIISQGLHGIIRRIWGSCICDIYFFFFFKGFNWIILCWVHAVSLNTEQNKVVNKKVAFQHQSTVLPSVLLCDFFYNWTACAYSTFPSADNPPCSRSLHPQRLYFTRTFSDTADDRLWMCVEKNIRRNRDQIYADVSVCVIVITWHDCHW